MTEVAKVVETLGAGPGVITLQLILNGRNKINFIEINPRYGYVLGVDLGCLNGLQNVRKWFVDRTVSFMKFLYSSSVMLQQFFQSLCKQLLGGNKK